jgi:hypothetical protein
MSVSEKRKEENMYVRDDGNTYKILTILPSSTSNRTHNNNNKDERRDAQENNNFSPTMFNIVSDVGDINQQRFAIAFGKWKVKGNGWRPPELIANLT